MKHLFYIVLCLSFLNLKAQERSGAAIFWDRLSQHCGKTFSGTVMEAPANDDFRGKTLLMHVRSCDDHRIRIPFFVGEDRSRTWVLTFDNDRITLKHDHRHEDGSEDKVTQYGGTATNTGLPNFQMFPADQETAALIGYASTNIWWITLDENTFTYNLRRIGTDRLFSVSFDLTAAVVTPEAPWGWED